MPVVCLDDVREGLEKLVPGALDRENETSKLLRKAQADLEYSKDPTE